MSCQHIATKITRTRCYSSSVNTWDPNPAAHGGVCEDVECLDCGARRSENLNGRHEEQGQWGPTREERRQTAALAESAARALVARRPAPLSFRRGEESASVGIDEEGYLVSDGPTGEQIAMTAPEFVEAAKALRAAVVAAEDARADV